MRRFLTRPLTLYALVPPRWRQALLCAGFALLMGGEVLHQWHYYADAGALLGIEAGPRGKHTLDAVQDLAVWLVPLLAGLDVVLWLSVGAMGAQLVQWAGVNLAEGLPFFWLAEPGSYDLLGVAVPKVAGAVRIALFITCALALCGRLYSLYIYETQEDTP